MKGTANRYAIALLSVMMICLLVMPAMADYDFDGFEVNDMTSGTVQGDVYVSNGTHAGLGNSPYTTSYNVPSGTVKWARLYVGIWGGTENKVGWVNTTFNNHCEGNVTLNKSVDTDTYSSGTNVYCSGHGVWMVSYNCTDNVTSGSVSATATTGGSIDGRVYGIALVVVYENSSLPKVEYWINEGNMNLNYVTPVNCNFAWFNGTAYNCTMANLTAVYYAGSGGQPDYLYFNPPDASDSPYSCSSIRWNITKYNDTQMNSNDVADSHSDQEGVCDDNSASTPAFDLNCFSHANDSTSLCEIVNHTANNYAVFKRGWDTDNDGAIDYDSWNSSDEGETYVHPIVAVLVLKNITHVYDFGDDYTGTPGKDAWAFKYQVDSSPGAGDPSIEFNTTEYAAIKADDGVFACNTTTDDDYYAAHRFNFSISESASEIKAINVTWIGKGWHDTLNDGAKLRIYNFTSGGYEELGSTTLDTEVTLTGEKTSSISSYISATNNVTILVNQTSAQTTGFVTEYSHICTDYVKLVIADP